MTNMNPAAAAARENSRRPTGEFGAQAHSTPDGELPASSVLSATVADEIEFGEAFELAADDYDAATETAAEINRQGWPAVVELRQTYREDSIHDGDIGEYESEDYTVHRLNSKGQLEGVLKERGTDTSDEKTFYSADDHVINYAEAIREKSTYFATHPEVDADEQFQATKIIPDDVGADDYVELGWIDDSYQDNGGRVPTNAALHFDEEAGTAYVSATMYENFLWDERFTEEELDRYQPIVEELYQERLGADLHVHDAGWESVDVSIASKDIPLDEVTNGRVGDEFHAVWSKLPPHPRIRVGLRSPLRFRPSPRRHLPGLGSYLQLPPTPYRHRRQVTHRTCPQRPWEEHLARALAERD